MKKIKFFSFLLAACLTLGLLAVPAAALSDPDVRAKAVLLADLDSGIVYYSKNADQKVYPASLTKIMTVLLAVEAIEAGEVSPYDQVTASNTCTFDMIEDASTANIQPGETMTLENLLYCALISSANEACNIIAEYIDGSVAKFVDHMNRRAEELGCTDTHFANTHGLPNEEHYTTASDFYLISAEAVSHSLFMEICDTPTFTVPATNVSEARVLQSTNGLINENSEYKNYVYPYAHGVKTGYTEAAGYCLVSTAQKDDIRLIAVVMGSPSEENANGTRDYYNFIDSIALYNWVFNNFSRIDIVSDSELVAEVPVSMGADADSVPLRPSAALSALLPADSATDNFERSITIYSEAVGETLTAPVEAGELLGEMTVSRDGVVYGTVPLVASVSIDLARSEYVRARIAHTLTRPVVLIVLAVLVILLIVYIRLIMRYRANRKRYLAAARRARAKQAQRQREQDAQEVFGAQTQQVPRPKRPPQPKPGSAVRDIEHDQAKRDYFEEIFGQKK